MSKKLTIHLTSCGQSKLNVIKAVKELTGLGLKESKELVDKIPSDFETTSEIDVVERVLHGAGAEFSWEDTSGTQTFVRPQSNPDTTSVRPPASDQSSQPVTPADSIDDYVTVDLPYLGSKREEAVKIFQEIMGIERWEAEIYVDKTPTSLSFNERDKADLLTSKIIELGFEVSAMIPAIHLDVEGAESLEKEMKKIVSDAETKIGIIRDAYNNLLPLVTLSELVSDLAIKEASLNIETAEKNLVKFQSIVKIAENKQGNASSAFSEFTPLKEKALSLLVSSQANMAFESKEFSFTSPKEMANKVVALFDDGKNLCNVLIKNAVFKINNFARMVEGVISSAKTLEKKGSDLMEKYSGDAIYEGLTALSEINFALPLPHTARGTVYRRGNLDSHCVPFVGVLVEIGGIVSPDADKTEADEKPSCYTSSTGEFIIVLPEHYSLKETIRIIVSQGSNRQVFLKSAAEFLYSVPEQRILDQFIEVDNLGRELSNLKVNLSELENDHDDFLSYKENLTISLDVLSRQQEENDSIDLDKMDPEVLMYVQALDINLEEAKGEVQREISALETKIKKVERSIEDVSKRIEHMEVDVREYESRFESRKKDLLADLKDKKHLSFPETTDLDKIFEAFLAKTTAPEAILEGTDLKDEYEGFVIIDEVFKGGNADAAKALPSVKLMGNEGKETRLPSDTAPSRVFTYSMLQRLVEPKLTFIEDEKSEERTEYKRIAMADPVDVQDFKDSMINNPDTYPLMSTLGMGYVLNMHQAWVPDGFALGSLLYSLILAPGEEQRLVVRENKQSYVLSDKAEGTDLVSEDYQLAQDDDTTAAYNYALNQLSTASSHYDYEASTWGVVGAGAFGGVGSGFAGMLGLSGGYSRSSGSGNSSARQSNSHNEASSAAQSFQHSIKSASDKIAQSKRISVSTASSEVSESAATKIVANHNHSHAMTIQYWEVMRRYRLETCVEGVDLVLFVPLKPIRFLPENQDQSLIVSEDEETNQPMITREGKDEKVLYDKTQFDKRYKILLKYAQTLQYALPYKYRQGLKLIQHFSALPKWELESKSNETTSISFSLKASLLSCDILTATLYLKNGKGSISATMAAKEEPKDVGDFEEGYLRTSDLLKALSAEREKAPSISMSCVFNLPDGIHEDDLSYIGLTYSCENVSIPLRFSDLDPEITSSGEWKGMKNEGDYIGKGFNQAQAKAIIQMADTYYNYIKDNKGSQGDLRNFYHYRQGVPECLSAYPDRKYVTLNETMMRKVGPVRIDAAKMGSESVTVTMTSDRLRSSMRMPLSTDTVIMKLTELRKIEETFMHVVSETMHYSQVIWNDLTADERAMMLEKYTIDMNFSSINDSLSFGDDDGIKDNFSLGNDGKKKNEGITIPLLNCVNVKKVMGFYGNCILMPFTYPSSLARKLGKTAGEIQDALYRYHTSSFRAPTTTISLPTSGMVGEAVLGETNVSEKIDITRFWNWQDSPIDKMTLDQNYLNGTDYLTGKSTQDITALGLQGAAAATPVTNVDLISALIKKQTPTFDDITGLDQLKEVVNAGTTSAASGRDAYLKEASALAGKALDVAAATEKKKGGNGQGGAAGAGGQGGSGEQGGAGGQGGSGGQGGAGGKGGAGGAGGPSASFTATLTFNTGDMTGKTTATSQSGPAPQQAAPDEQAQSGDQGQKGGNRGGSAPESQQ